MRSHIPILVKYSLNLSQQQPHLPLPYPQSVAVLKLWEIINSSSGEFPFKFNLSPNILLSPFLDIKLRDSLASRHSAPPSPTSWGSASGNTGNEATTELQEMPVERKAARSHGRTCELCVPGILLLHCSSCSRTAEGYFIQDRNTLSLVVISVAKRAEEREGRRIIL